MPQFEVGNVLAQVVWLGLIFGLLYLLLAYGALPRVQRILDKRDEAIGGNLAIAEDKKAQAARMAEDYENSLAQARTKGAEVTGAAKEDISAAIAKKMLKLDADLDNRLDLATAALERARAQALSEFDSYAVDISSDIVEKLIQKRPGTTAVEATIARMKH